MSGQEVHPHIPLNPFTPFQQVGTAITNDSTPIAIDFDNSSTTATMPTLEELQTLAAAQAEQLQKATDMINQQQQQMVDAQSTFEAQAQQLRDSAEQLRQQQQTINQLSSAFQTLTTATAATTTTTSRKKPEMPAFDQQNILVWLRRLQAAYDRAGVVLAKDKFAYLESTFDINFNPIINNYLFNTNNTDEDWVSFVAYMKQEYGPTIRQKARKLIGDLPRNGMKPSQYLSQLEDEVRDVKLDDVKREHLLKTIPPRIREIMGKVVETKTAAEVAKMADQYFDSQGRPLEKSATTISSVVNTTATPSNHSSASSSFTAAYSDEEAEVNFVKKGKFSSFKSRSRSRPRHNNNNSRPAAAATATASTASSSSTATPRQQQQSNNLCRFHRMFGDSATRCISNCSRHSSFIKKQQQQQQQQQQGNATGGRRQ